MPIKEMWSDLSGDKANGSVSSTCSPALSAGLFAGAAAYVTFVEHPARMQCGIRLAATEFAPSYKRATLMQAPLAAIGFLRWHRGMVVRIARTLGRWWHSHRSIDSAYADRDCTDEQAVA